jgi:hypothetical protein
VHFLLIGAAMSIAYALVQPETDARDSPARIVVTADDIRQMSVAWLAQGRPPLTPEQTQNLIDAKVREEVLFREALALGIDRNDTIVKRRMVQKMEFLADDVSDLREPTRDDLDAWLQQHPDRFALAPRVTFRHLYFSPDRHGAETRRTAERALTALAGTTEPPADIADPFMLQDYYPDRTPEQIAKEFGPAFGRSLFALEPGAWRGPVESGFGWHLVLVESLTPARVPPLEEVEDEVRIGWIDAQRDDFQRKAFEEMKSRYVIVVDPASAP